MTKTITSCNWVASQVTEQTLDEHVQVGVLAAKNVIHWHSPSPDEARPQPKENEVIFFTDHINRGFSPPGSKFFRDVLHFMQLHPQDIGPNSISNICNFQVFCEVYLQEEPSVDLFREYFYLNRQNKFTDGPSQELGGISIQRCRDAIFPYAQLPSHPKDWNQTWFYTKILLLLMKTPCQASVTNGSTRSTLSPTGLPLLNGPNLHLPSQRLGHYWAMD